MSRIEQLIGEIEMYLDSCKSQAFSNSKRIVVEKDVIDEMLVELRMRTPEEIKKYQKIIANKDAILADAKSRADAMIADANRQTAQKRISFFSRRRHRHKASWTRPLWMPTASARAPFSIRIISLPPCRT